MFYDGKVATVSLATLDRLTSKLHITKRKKLRWTINRLVEVALGSVNVVRKQKNELDDQFKTARRLPEPHHSNIEHRLTSATHPPRVSKLH